MENTKITFETSIPKYTNIFILTATIATSIFFLMGNLFFKQLVDYNDWIYVFFPIHIVLAFMIMFPLIIPFHYLDKFVIKRKYSVYFKWFLHTVTGAIYISLILWFSIFSDQQQRIKNPESYFELLQYLGFYSLISLVSLASVEIYKYHKLKR